MKIKKEHIKPNLLKLLEENNCVEEFLENTNNQHRNNKNNIIRVISDTDDSCGQILGAFNWKNSPEGSRFWINIQNKLPND